MLPSEPDPKIHCLDRFYALDRGLAAFAAGNVAEVDHELVLDVVAFPLHATGRADLVTPSPIV